MSIKDLVPRIGKGRVSERPRRAEQEGLLSFQREVNRLFDDFFRSFDDFRPAPWGGGGWESDEHVPAPLAYHPRIDVSETDKEVRVSAELPGLDEKDINVELNDTGVTIRGEKKSQREEKGENWFRKEQSFGSFYRSVPLPTAVEGDKAKAKFRKGVLTITLPKRPGTEAPRRTINIEAD